MKKGKIKKQMVALLVTSMIINTLQGSVWASATGSDNEQVSIIQIDTEKLRLAAENATEDVESAEQTLPPEMLLVARTSEVEISSSPAASPSEATASEAASTGTQAVEFSYEIPEYEDLPFENATFELADAESLLVSGCSMPAETDLRIFLEPDMNGYDFDEEEEEVVYTLTGEETLIFMIANEGSEARAYQLQFGNKVTDLLIVESKKEMLKEYKNAMGEEEEELEEILEEEIPEESSVVGESATPSDATEVEGPASDTEFTETEEGSAVEESSSDVTEESEADEGKSEEIGENEASGSDENESVGNVEDESDETVESEPTETEEDDSAETDEDETSGTVESDSDEIGNTTEGETADIDDSANGDIGNDDGNDGEDSTVSDTGNEGADDTGSSAGDDGGNDTGSDNGDDSSDSNGSDTGNDSSDGSSEGAVTVAKASIWTRMFDFLTGKMTVYASETNPAQAASPSEAQPATLSQVEPITTEDEKESVKTSSGGTKFSGALDSGYEKLEAASVNLLIKKNLETTGSSMGFFAMLFADDESDEFNAKDSNTSSVGVVALTLNSVAAVASTGNDIFTINVYDYAPYSGTVYKKLVKDNSSGQYSWSTLTKPEYSTDLNREHINAYLAGNGSKIRFGRPYSFAPGASSVPTGAYNDYVRAWDTSKDGSYPTYTNSSNTTETVKQYFYNITQGIPDLDHGKYLDLLFPDEDQKFKFDVDGNGTTEDAIVVKVYSDVNSGEDDNAFLQLGDDGYWEYSSDEYKVSFDTAKKELRRNGAQSDGDWGFWPFGQGTSPTTGSKTSSDQFYYGLSLDFDFYMPSNGKYNGQDMSYWFSGDDDVLIYVENTKTGKEVLALDMGGVHDRVSGSINFATGEIIYEKMASKKFTFSPLLQTLEGVNKYSDYTGTYSGESINNVTGPIRVYLYDDKSEEQLSAEGYADSVGLSKAEGMYHLKMYYMERGDGASNCSMRFNLPVIPKTGLTLQKQITGTETEISEKMQETYTFDFVYASDETTIRNYHNGTTAVPAENKKNFSITGSNVASSTEEFLRTEDYYFYLVETDSRNAAGYDWTVTGPTQVTGTEDAGNKTAIYKVEAYSGTSCIVTCENIYSDPIPTAEKEAWKDYTKSDASYDITLEVNGDSVYTKTPYDAEDQYGEEHKATNVVVTDVLSDYVELTDSVTVNGITGPKLYLKNGTVANPSGNTAIADTAKGDELSYTAGTGENEGSIVYGEDAANPVAIYDPDNRTIIWNVADTLGDGEVKTLTFKVRASDMARYKSDSDEYPHTAEEGTGTHAETKGYYSNDNDDSEMTYGTNGVQNLPDPVIHPISHTIQLTKAVDENVVEDLGTGTYKNIGTLPSTYDNTLYTFEIGFTSSPLLGVDDVILQDANSAQIAVAASPSEASKTAMAAFDKAGQKLTVKVKAGTENAVKIIDLPRYVTSYTVTEILQAPEELERFEAFLQGMTHDKDTAVKDTASKTVSHTFGVNEQADEITFTNQYRYRYGTLVIHKDLVQKEDKTTAAVADRDVSFSFTIDDQTAGYNDAKFHTGVIVKADESTGEVTLKVPIGTYDVTEKAALGYTAADDGTETGVKVTETTVGHAYFKNYNNGNHYFYDVSSVVNKVTVNGFSPVRSDTP